MLKVQLKHFKNKNLKGALTTFKSILNVACEIVCISSNCWQKFPDFFETFSPSVRQLYYHLQFFSIFENSLNSFLTRLNTFSLPNRELMLQFRFSDDSALIQECPHYTYTHKKYTKYSIQHLLLFNILSTNKF